MRTTLKRALVAGAVAVAIGVPVGAYAATGPMDTDEPETTETETWTPPRQQNQDCDAPPEVKAILDEAEIKDLEAEHQQEMTQRREDWRANPDPDGREEFRADMTALRDEHRAEVIEAVKALNTDEAAAAAEWLADHWASIEGAGFGQGGNGQGNGYGRANGPRNGDGHRAGGFRNGDGVGVQEQLRNPATD